MDKVENKDLSIKTRVYCIIAAIFIITIVATVINTALGLLIALAVLYFVPATIARWSTKKRATTAIFLINLFFGWTVIGWFGALVWSVIPDHDSPKPA